MSSFLLYFLLWSCSFQALRAQKGPNEVALPVCNSRDLSITEAETFNEIIRIANSSFPCKARNKNCCEDNLLDGNMSIMCNAEVNLCQIRTPSSRRPGRQGNLNIVSIARCARPGQRCKLSTSVCTRQEIFEIIFRTSNLNVFFVHGTAVTTSLRSAAWCLIHLRLTLFSKRSLHSAHRK
eukprot:IDg1485t1